MPLFGSNVTPYKGQVYEKLKKECQQQNRLFYDTEFPPEDRSLFYSSGKLAGVVWKRPKQICSNPKLFVEGASSGDVTQGRLGNCWFVAASSCLAQYKELWNRVIPDADSQEWNENKPENYQGIFHFRFWRYGKWVDVVIDDQLPTLNDELIFIHSKAKNEFWSALLEKAYAKLFDCYEALDGGDLGEALEDFTGGVSEQIDVVKQGLRDNTETRANFFAKMQKEMDRKFLMAASIPAETRDEMEAAAPMGLVKGHAYGITAVKNIALQGSGLFGLFNREKISMVRLRNPWGQGEWKGPFSDGSEEWNKIAKSDREKIGLTFEEDGEFWMTMDDFCKYFENISFCRTVNTSWLSLSKTWHEGICHSAWKKPNLCGGCLNNKETFTHNPQFVFDIVEDEDEPIMQLMQKSTRGKEGSNNVTIGFTILKVEENRIYRIHDYTFQDVVHNSVFRDSRSIFRRDPLKKGRYVVVTCTFDPNIEREFLFRIYTSAANGFRELIVDKPERSFWNCCAKRPVAVIQIKILKAEGLEKQDRTGADPYCIISCEGEKVRTPTVKDTINPEWNCSAVFYRKNPLKKPVKVQIWNNNVLRDKYMGKHLFISSDDCVNSIQQVDLVGRGKEGNQQRSGKLTVQMTQTKNLLAL
ncbi:hypothetical protein ACJMK2_019283 [Sinanodonta woodiana]|uniref:Calpain-5 n=1 Tax=Sinanodonta woodiana TaxID=1069815 RepID=A0ABD3UJD7_SINWO